MKPDGRNAIGVAIADDHALVREGTRQILEDQPGLEVVGEAQDGEAAAALVSRLHPPYCDCITRAATQMARASREIRRPAESGHCGPLVGRGGCATRR